MTEHAPDPVPSSKMNWTPVKILTFGLLLVFYAVILIHKIDAVRGEDLPRLVKNGETLFHNADVLTKNVYSYTEPDQPFANHHWLSSVIFYGLHEVVGYGGLVIFKAVVLLVTFSLLFFLALKRADFWLVAMFSVPSIWMLASRIQVRPEMFSYLLICVYLWLLFDAQRHPEKNWIYWLLPLQAMWVNLHIFFSIGVFLVWGFLLEIIVQQPKGWRQNPLVKKLAIVSLLLPVACLLNPFGINGIIFTLALNVSKTFPIGIVENQSLWPYLSPVILASNRFMVMLVVSVLMFTLSFILAWRKKPVFYALGFLATAVMSMWMVRALPFFVFIFLPGVTSNFQDFYLKILDTFKLQSLQRQRLLTYGAQGSFVIFLVILIVLRLTSVTYAAATMGVGFVHRSTDTAEFLLDNQVRGPIFNDPDIGSYLIYYLYPQEKVFIDNRFGDAYSAEFVAKDFLPMMLDETVWQQKSEAYHIQTLVLSVDSQLNGLRQFIIRRVNDSEWALVHADQHAVVFVRNQTENQALIEAHAITADNLADRLRYLTESDHRKDVLAAIDIMNLFDQNELAMATSLTVVDRWPKTSYIWLMLGVRALDDEQASAALPMLYIERAITLGQKSTYAYAKLAEAYERVGFHERAIWAAQRALQMSPQKDGLRRLIDQMEQNSSQVPALQSDLQSHVE